MGDADRLPAPKDRFTALDTLALVRELRALHQPRVDKAFDLPTGGWSFVFRPSGGIKRELQMLPGRYAALLEPTGDHPETPGPLARDLRRLLSGSSLRPPPDPGGERVLELEFRRTDPPEPYHLILELFGTGNLTVVHQGRIVALAKSRRWAHRQLRVGAEYAAPPGHADPFHRSANELAGILRDSTKELVSTLAARAGFGGPIAEELLARTQLPGGELASADAASRSERLTSAVGELLAEIGDVPRGFLYLRGEEPVDATPYPSARWAGRREIAEVRTATFSETSDRYFRARLATLAPRTEAGERPRAEKERQRDQQRRAVADLTAESQRQQEKAEAIYRHYAEAEAALAAPVEGEPSGLVEVDLGGTQVSLQRGRSLRESAAQFYVEAKRSREKLAGATAALAETEAWLSKDTVDVTERASAPEVGPRGRSKWFERHRWFVAHHGEIVVAGRDAASNDLIVRRYLKDGDCYVHADLHGAASVVVKHVAAEPASIPEETLREAGQFAVAYSKAWRAGLASASAFWVTPDQVSKAGSTGEFVARGAWAIHGTKHFLKNLPLELGIGTIVHEGRTLWTVAPPSAFPAHGVVRFLLTPGEERDRAVREVELSRELGLPRDRLQGLLPAGGISARRA